MVSIKNEKIVKEIGTGQIKQNSHLIIEFKKSIFKSILSRVIFMI